MVCSELQGECFHKGSLEQKASVDVGLAHLMSIFIGCDQLLYKWTQMASMKDLHIHTSSTQTMCRDVHTHLDIMNTLFIAFKYFSLMFLCS